MNNSKDALYAAKPKKGIRWKQVFQYQTHGAWVLLVAAAVVIAVSHYFAPPQYKRLVKLDDPTIGLPMEPDTVPMTWAVAFPTAALIATMIVIEFGIMHKKQTATQAIQAFFHVFWMALVGFAVVLAVTEATKPVASRYRPDFLSRCTGKDMSNENSTDILTPSKCAQADPEVLADGKKSFPSGHSSNTMSICWYCVVYIVHALYFRQGFYHMGGLGVKAYSPKGKFGQKLLMELLQGVMLVWLCVVICIAWWIGISRFTDHKHNIDDILGGFVAALLWMTPIAIIAMSQLSHYHKTMTASGDAALDPEQELPIAHIPSNKNIAAPVVAALPSLPSLNGARAIPTAGYDQTSVDIPVVESLGNSLTTPTDSQTAAARSVYPATGLPTTRSGDALVPTISNTTVVPGLPADAGLSHNLREHESMQTHCSVQHNQPRVGWTQSWAGACHPVLQHLGSVKEAAAPHHVAGDMYYSAHSSVVESQYQQSDM